MNRIALLRILTEEGLIKQAAFRKGDVVSYKGRSYRLLWSGSTKYGDRARLQFMDGSKDFWVDLGLVSPATSGGSGGQNRNSPARRGGCRGCGGPIRNAPHHRAMGGYCGYCAFDEFDM